jgi:putative ABC transport system permease protein
VQWSDNDLPYLQTMATECQYILPELEQETVRTHSAYNNAAFLVSGSMPEFGWVRTLNPGEGRFYNESDVKEARRVAFLGTDAAKQLFPGTSAVGQLIHLNDFPYTVIGVMQKKKQDSSYDGWDVNKVFIPFTTMQRDFPAKPPAKAHDIDQFLVTPRTVDLHDVCKYQIRRALGHLHNFDANDKEACPIWDTVQEAKAFETMTNGMKYFLGAVGLVTLVLGGLGVMNVMLVAVRERTREIGVRKALGARSGEILRQFFFEALLIAALSGAVGLGIAYGLCALVNMLPMPDFFAGLLPTWGTGVLACTLLGMIAVFSALYPAKRAASVDPIEALRYEAGG